MSGRGAASGGESNFETLDIGRRRRTAITAALLTGTFLSSIEVTVVATAMPSIVAQLGDLALFPWVFSAYLLAATVTVPLYGRLADFYGRRPVFVSGVAIFLCGSVLCGLAGTMEMLVIARAVQGLGAGCVLPLTMTIFGDLYEVSARTKLQGVFSLVWGASAIAGPLAGGAIVQSWSWHWVFFLNLPFGVVSAVVVAVLLREKAPPRKGAIDLLGAALLAAATLLLLLSLLPASQRPWGVSPLFWLLGAALVALLFILQERRHPQPLLPLKLFRDRVQLAANITGVLLGVVLFGVVSYVPLYIQEILGGSPTSAGAMLIPLSLGWTVASFAGGQLVKRVGFTRLVRLGCLCVGAGSLLGYAGLHTGLYALALAGFIIYGLGMGFCISSFTVSVQIRVPMSERGIATALTQFSRSIGGALGVAVLGVVMTGAGAGADSDLQGLLDQEGGREALAAGLRTVFTIVAGTAAAAAVTGAILFPRMDSSR